MLCGLRSALRVPLYLSKPFFTLSLLKLLSVLCSLPRSTAETLVDKAMELDHFGGTFGGSRKATPFMCLTLKMLQIQPEKEIVVEFIKNEDYK